MITYTWYLNISFTDGPFETSWPLQVYGLLVWMVFQLVCLLLLQVYVKSSPNLTSAVLLMSGVVNLYFIYFLCIDRTSLHLIMNRFFRLCLKFRHVSLQHSDVFVPFLPLAVYIPKIIFDFEWIVDQPVIHGLEVIYLVVYVVFHGLIYSWFVFGEKCLVDISMKMKRHPNHQLASDLKALTNIVLDIEEFVRSISKTFGALCLLASLMVFTVYIVILSSEIIKIVYKIATLSHQTVIDLIHTTEWNIFPCVMFFICYQSHRFSLQVNQTSYCSIRTLLTLES